MAEFGRSLTEGITAIDAVRYLRYARTLVGGLKACQKEGLELITLGSTAFPWNLPRRGPYRSWAAQETLYR
jgi:hypothetical protein